MPRRSRVRDMIEATSAVRGDCSRAALIASLRDKICDGVYYISLLLLTIIFSMPALSSEDSWQELAKLEVCNSKDGLKRPIHFCLGYFEPIETWRGQGISGASRNLELPEGDPRLLIWENILLKTDSISEIENISIINNPKFTVANTYGNTHPYFPVKTLIELGQTLSNNARQNRRSGFDGSQLSMRDKDFIEMTGKSGKEWGFTGGKSPSASNVLYYFNEISDRYNSSKNISMAIPSARVEDYCSSDIDSDQAQFQKLKKRTRKDLKSNKINLFEALNKEKHTLSKVSVNFYVTPKNNLFEKFNSRATCDISVEMYDKKKKDRKFIKITTDAFDTSPIINDFFNQKYPAKKILELKKEYEKRFSQEKDRLLNELKDFSDKFLMDMILSREGITEASDIDFTDTITPDRLTKGEYEKTIDFNKRKSDYLNSIDYGKFYGFCNLKNYYDVDKEVLVFGAASSCNIDSDYGSWSGITGTDYLGNEVDVEIKFSSEVSISIEQKLPELLLGYDRHWAGLDRTACPWSGGPDCKKYAKTLEIPLSIPLAKQSKNNLRTIVIFMYDKNKSSRLIRSKKTNPTTMAANLRYENKGTMDSTVIGFALINIKTNEVIYFENIMKNNYLAALKLLEDQKWIF